MNALFDLNPYTVKPQLTAVTISRVPTMDTIAKNAWGRPHNGLQSESDAAFLRRWKYVHLMHWLRRNLIDPVGYEHGRHYWMPAQIADPLWIGEINAEFARRGFNNVYQLVIDIPARLGRGGWSGRQVNEHLDENEL